MNHIRLHNVLTAVVLLALVGPVAARAQNVVQDGDFQSATLGAHTAGTDIGDGVFFVTNGQLDVVKNIFDPGNSLQFYNKDGFPPFARISQSLTLDPTLTYSLSFDFSKDFTPGDVGNITVLLGNTTIASFDPFITSGPFTANYLTPTSANTFLAFQFSSTAYDATRNNNDLIYIDNVSLTPNAASVPEPAFVSMSVLLAGLGGAGLLRYRRRARR